MKKKPDHWKFYRGRDGEWRWTHRAGNGRIVGASNEGFKRYAACVKNATRNGYQNEADDLTVRQSRP